MDARRFVSHLTDDARLRFANAPAVEGREAIEEASASFFTTIGGLRHRVLEEWEADGTTIVEAEVTYTRHDGDQVSLPAAIILRRTGPDGEKVSDYRIFVDQGPLYA